MDILTWLAYSGVITALIAFPGPSSMLISLHGYQYGLPQSNITIVGNALGSLVLMALAVIGLGAVLSSSHIAFQIAKGIGALYLIYLGIKTWKQSSPDLTLPGAKENALKISSISLLSKGFFTGISNPKDLIFFTALFPVFLKQETSLLPQFITLMATWVSIDYGIKLLYAVTGHSLRKKFTQPSFLNLFNKTAGGCFILMGLGLASANK